MSVWELSKFRAAFSGNISSYPHSEKEHKKYFNLSNIYNDWS